ncbi:MAG: acyl-CoA desaturase [Alphaproteobacteria bacterium]
MIQRLALEARRWQIPKSWRNLSWQSIFAAVVYPLLGLIGFAAALAVGFGYSNIHIYWWYLPLALGAAALCLFLCNQGIGPLHRIWQHRAGQLKAPVQFLIGLNCILAMQGKIRDWVNYHAQHHRYSDGPGDPHNPAEGRLWAWIGWVIWRDPEDLRRPMVHWLKNNRIVGFADRYHVPLSLTVHVGVPLSFYLLVWALGGPLILVLLVHTATIIGRGVHFHATTLGVNVVGHVKAPKWLTWTLAVLTGGEALHTHHHAYPKSILHLPQKGLLNRLVDYNGTILLVLGKLGLAGDFHIAPQFLAKQKPVEFGR